MQARTGPRSSVIWPHGWMPWYQEYGPWLSRPSRKADLYHQDFDVIPQEESQMLAAQAQAMFSDCTPAQIHPGNPRAQRVPQQRSDRELLRPGSVLYDLSLGVFP